MQDTIFKVKADLGPDAIILNTRKYKKGLFGWFGPSQVEVLAALEEKKEDSAWNQQTWQELNSMKNMLRELQDKWQEDDFARGLPKGLKKAYHYLKLQGLKPEILKKIIQQFQAEELTDAWLPQLLEEELEKILGDPAPIKEAATRQVVAFVGPTGVGKTTTIAKLAARYSLDKGWKVALVTADTFRIAAVQQLKTYSDIMNIPLHVIYNAAELQELIKDQLRDYDLILFDTAGSSWNDQIQLGRLKEFVNRQLVDEVHLMLSLNTKAEELRQAVEKFSLLQPDKIILSKLDETLTFGDIINLKKEYQLPYSYITFGQDVPDDIAEAESKLLLKYLIGGYHD